MNEPIVKLRRNGQIINISRLPDSIVESIYEAFRLETDPYTILAAYAYIFAGLNIDEIRERFVLTDCSKTRIASREYIRQKIRTIYVAIKNYHTEHYGDIDITTIYSSGAVPIIAGAVRTETEEESLNEEEIESAHTAVGPHDQEEEFNESEIEETA